MVDLLFDWFGFNQTSEYVTNSAVAKQQQYKRNKQEVNFTVILPLTK